MRENRKANAGGGNFSNAFLIMQIILENHFGDVISINNVSELKRDGGTLYIYHKLPESRFLSVRVVMVSAVRKMEIGLIE